MSCHSFQRIPGCRDPSTKKLENRNPTQTNLEGPPRKREQMKKAQIAPKLRIRRTCQLKQKCAPDSGPTFQLDWRMARSGRAASRRGIDATRKRESTLRRRRRFVVFSVFPSSVLVWRWLGKQAVSSCANCCWIQKTEYKLLDKIPLDHVL